MNTGLKQDWGPASCSSPYNEVSKAGHSVGEQGIRRQLESTGQTLTLHVREVCQCCGEQTLYPEGNQNTFE